MVRRRTVDLLPEIFRTDTNRKFLAATLDQMVSEPNMVRTQGFVGRRVGPGVNPADNYVVEPTAQRADYQLEPGVVFLRPDTNRVQDSITYPGMLSALDLAGGFTQQQDRLWQSQYYTWDPFCDLDKFINYSQYYWLPQGPDAVDVSRIQYPLTDDFVVDRTAQGYTLSGWAGTNPEIVLVRGGTYRFEVDQPGVGFWIQAAPGSSGVLPFANNISSRDVLGAINNGASQGTVTFEVPLKTAQDLYYEMPSVGSVDLVTSLKFNQINNVYVDDFLAANPNGIDGIRSLDQRTLIFLDQSNTAEAGGWERSTFYDPLNTGPDSFPGEPGTYDSIPFDLATPIEPKETRYSIWQVNYRGSTDRPYMVLTSVRTVPDLNKLSITFGSVYSNTQWFKNSSGYFEQIPLLTALQDFLYYQDSQETDRFGIIRLIDAEQTDPLDINEIVGSQIYTSPNGVRFTNGLKVIFRGLVSPASFRDREFYVEGVGSGPGPDLRVGYVDGEAYFGDFYVINGQKVTGNRDDGTAQQFIYDDIQESEINRGRGPETLDPLPVRSIPGAVNGNGIRLIPVESLITPERYLLEESTDQDPLTPIPLLPDYVTMNRSSSDLNAWSRSNRWFHEQVITDTARYNQTIPVFDNRQRAKRPIIEFRGDIRLFDGGTQGIDPVDVIDFEETDALSNIAGTTGYTYDGYEFQPGTRVIFAADVDPDVRNRVYRVDFIDPDGEPGSPPIINLVPQGPGPVLVNQMTVCRRGDTQIGSSFWFDGESWQAVQAKTGINQAILFDVYDTNGRSFGDSALFPSTTFRGSRLFGYAVQDIGAVDNVLGLRLRYRNIDNIGDIVFENYLYTDEFVYVRDRVGTTVPISSGVVRQYTDRVSFSDLIGWVPAQAENRSRQVFRFQYQDQDLILDVPVVEDFTYPPLQVFVGGVFRDPETYQVERTATNTFITLLDPPEVGTVIEVQAISDQASRVAFYQIPLNLEYNALNQDSDSFTLGTIRNHYQSICQNNPNIRGNITGSNNSRDLGNILPYGTNIVQQSSPMVLAGAFLRRPQFSIFDALRYNSQEYEKYKALMIDLVAQGDFINNTPSQVLDQVIDELGLGRTETNPFYWSDMIPGNETFTERSYTVTPITISVFDLTQIYDFTSSNFQSVLVYLNGRLLTRGYEYTVGQDSATVTVTVPLQPGNVVTIREYSSTYGSFVPNTPTKMGLYPAFRPEKFIDTSYVTPTAVIRGHDGSITRAYDDIRDDVLLEFETRIFNNIKIHSEIPIVAAEVVPGQFRVTNYTQAEITTMLSTDFLSWVGWNRLDYTQQDYQANNAFTYNYSASSNKLNNQPLLGAWRGIYEYFYDTDAPNTSPWEMLGFSEKPSWWEEVYGPPPYTSGNLVLWEDLANGIVADPLNPSVRPLRRRPGLLDVIPVGSEGELLSPLDVMVGLYDPVTFRRAWTVGDDGPVEAAWRNSSSYPFAVMRLLALTRPAEFFSLFADRDRYRFDPEVGQYLWQGRYRLDSSRLAPLYGDGTSRASYINWIIDYNRQRGINSTRDLETMLVNTDVRLCWRLASFSDKRLLKLYVERSTPGGSNSGFLLPDESYQLMLYQNQPSVRVGYSSVIVQTVENGWIVQGYNVIEPYFTIRASRTRGLTRELSAGGYSVQVNTQYTDNLVQVPYGFRFPNRAAVCDFLLSYGQYLQDQGLTFDTQENGYIMNWNQMCVEFLYWSAQGWEPGTLINLNPAASDITISQPGLVAQSLTPPTVRNLILDQNRQPIPLQDLVIDRLDNTIRLRAFGTNTMNSVSVDFTNWEHILVLDNASLFGDLVYEPVTGSRQSRILVSGWKSGDWDGQVQAPGFVLNEDNVQEWRPNRGYTKGEIVLFKDEYWSAAQIVQPAQTFNYSDWIRSDFDEIQIGLLSNAATGSVELAQSYDTYRANLEQEIDLFSYGLIGFRPRQYMQALNLDDVSQVNLYKQFLGTKGTRPSLEIFSLADLGKETAQYDIYEYWSVLRGTYGANANRSYIELLLDQSRLAGNPSIVQLTQPGEPSIADQTVLVSQVWKSSRPVTNTDIFTTLPALNPDLALTSAGYVNFEDIDFTTFSLDAADIEASNIELDQIGVGTTIWVARTNSYDWNVYSCEYVPAEIIAVSDNLNGQALVTFRGQHGLSSGNTLIIRFFDPDIDGIYQVQAVTGLDSLLILYTFEGFQSVITGIGTAFTLASLRVRQPADTVSLPISRDLQPGARIWVDNDASGAWEVLEKTQPFVTAPDLEPDPRQGNSGYGQSLAQGLLNLTAFVGAPEYVDDAGNVLAPPGQVYTWVRDRLDQYVPGDSIQLNTLEVQSFGASIDIGDQSWAIVGAPRSNLDQGYAAVIYNPPYSATFEQRQILIAPDLDWSDALFGNSVTMSQDESWVYVGAPGQNKVYAFGRVEIQSQTVEYTATGNVSVFNYDDSILADPGSPEQVQVLLDNRILFAGNNVPGYSTSGGNVVLNFTPSAGQKITLSRRDQVQLDRRLYYNVPPSEVVSIDSVENLTARFTVDVFRGNRSPTVTDGGEDYHFGDSITIYGNAIGGGGNLSFDVTQVGPEYVTIPTAVAGQTSIVISAQAAAGITVGQDLYKIQGGGEFAPGTQVANVDPVTGVIDLSQPLLVSGDIVFMASPNPITNIGNISGQADGIGNIDTFDVLSKIATATDIWSMTIQIDDVLQRPYIDYTYSAGNVTFVTVPPQGAEILVSSRDHYRFTDTISIPGQSLGAEFGRSISTTTDGRQLIVSAPYETAANLASAGVTYVFDRSVQKFVVDDTSSMTYFLATTTTAPVTVYVNGVKLGDAAVDIDGQYTVTNVPSPSVTFENIQLDVGDVIEIETNQFELIQTIQAQTPNADAAFGYQVDQCVNDCSLYISAPFDSTRIRRGGLVEFLQNQARVYGTISSANANATLTPGDSLRVNNIYVTVSDPAAWTSSQSWAADVFVVSSGDVYRSIRAVPAATPIDDTAYWEASSWAAVMAQDINNSVSNVLAQATQGTLRISIKNRDAGVPLNLVSVLPGTGTVFQDLGFAVYYPQQIIAPPVDQQQAQFGQSLFISDDTVTLVVGAPTGSMLLPTTFDQNETIFDAGSTEFFESILESGAVYEYDFLPATNASILNPGQFVFGQQIIRRTAQPFDRFGTALDLTTGVLLVGSPGDDLGENEENFGVVMQLVNASKLPSWQTIRRQTPVVDMSLINTMYMYNRFTGSDKQYFDFFDPLQGRLLGAVRQNLDYIGAQDPASYNVGPINNQGSRWAQDRVGQIWWDTGRARFIDPNQNDPIYASLRWGQLFPGSQVNIYQWVSSSAPPADYEGPGTAKSLESYVVSTGVDQQGLIQVTYYFWVSGIASVNRAARKTLSIETLARYIENPRGSGISYIAPISSSTVAIYNGAEYVSALDTVLHMEYDQQFTDAAVHVEYQLVAQDRADSFLDPVLYRKFVDSLSGIDFTGAPVPDPFLPPSEKFGVQFRPRQSMFQNRLLALQNYITAANRVLLTYPAAENRIFNILNRSDPEPTAASGQWDERLADYEELTYQDIYAVSVGFRYLVVSDETNNGLWTIYQVQQDVGPAVRFLELVRVQTYDTRQYWQRVDWYEAGFDPLSRITRTVPNVAALQTLTLPQGSLVKVLANLQGRFEIYVRENSGWRRVALEDGTIQILPQIWNYQLDRYGFDVEVFDAQYFDQEPAIETRNIIEAINQEIFVDDFAIERNRLLILMFNFILTEQLSPDWLTKTSLIDVQHTIRELAPFQIYREDNQDFVIDYIQEVKPYHTQIRDFSLRYLGQDTYPGNAVDFDLPAYWDPAQQLFISPVLDDSGEVSSTSSVPVTSPIWRQWPYDQWFRNYLLELESVTVTAPGSGYTVPPQVEIVGPALRTAVMEARINSLGQVSAIVVVDPGQGYSATPEIIISGGNGSGARAAALMGNGLVRSVTTRMRFDRYQYRSDIQIWSSTGVYDNGERVRYRDRVYEANSPDSTQVVGPVFDPDDWIEIPASDLGGLDRTQGYYVPGDDMPGLDLPQLIRGLDYPGVQVYGTPFPDTVNYPTPEIPVDGVETEFPFPTATGPFSEITNPVAQVTVTVSGVLQVLGQDYTLEFNPNLVVFADPPVINSPIIITVGYPFDILGDAVYASEFTDTLLGTRATDINVSGGAFVDTYESHAPEELMPGIGFDTLDMRVFTTPGSDWLGFGHGFPQQSITRRYNGINNDIDFSAILPYPTAVQVYNQNTGLELSQGIDFTVDWPSRTLSLISGVAAGQTVRVLVYELGGGNQLYRNSWLGQELGNQVVIPIERDLIFSVALFVNGAVTPVQFINDVGSGQTEIVFFQTYTAQDYLVLTVFGGNTNFVNYSWSLPQTQYFVYDGTPTFALTNFVGPTNPINVIVNVNGARVQPPGSIEYLGTGFQASFLLPPTAGYNDPDIQQNQVRVYVDQTESLAGVSWTLDPDDLSTQRGITFVQPPALGSRITISVSTASPYSITGSTMSWNLSRFVLSPGDIVSVTSWNDTRQQELLTQVWQGPRIEQGAVIAQGYDDTVYDAGVTTGDPGSFSYTIGSVVSLNRFNTGRVIGSPSRLVVSVNGLYLFPGQGYSVQGSEVVIAGAPLSPADIIVITSYARTAIPGSIAFRIFQDMRGVQTSYRITQDTTTTLTQPLTSVGDVIHVSDATRLPQPDLVQGTFGQITVNGERITYRELNVSLNTVSGLRRGAAGTGAADHATGSLVYDISLGNALPLEYQDRFQTQTFLANGAQTQFVASNISVLGLDSTELIEAVRVQVGGISIPPGPLTYQVLDSGPVTIEFNEPPPSGVQVAIQVLRGKSWYQPGIGTASDGVALQETNTAAARFIRGI